MQIRKRTILLAVLAAAVLLLACAAGEETPMKVKMPETLKLNCMSRGQLFPTIKLSETQRA